MKRIHHLKDLISDIKKTEEIISLHKYDEFQLVIDQYEAIKARQVVEFIDELPKTNEINHKKDIILASDKDREIFFNALLYPSGPNQALLEAAESYKKFMAKM